MTTSLFDTAVNAFARGDIAWKSGGSTVRAFLVTSSYTPDFTSDQFVSDIPSAARAGNGGQSNRTNAPQLTLLDPSGGVCDANDLTFSLIPAGELYTAVVLFKDDGVSDDSSQLIVYIDNSTGSPLLSNGADILMTFSDGPNRIFKL